MKETKKNIGKYEVEKELGKGQFGVVSLARSKDDGKLFAIKCINKEVGCC